MRMECNQDRKYCCDCKYFYCEENWDSYYLMCNREGSTNDIESFHSIACEYFEEDT